MVLASCGEEVGGTVVGKFGLLGMMDRVQRSHCSVMGV